MLTTLLLYLVEISSLICVRAGVHEIVSRYPHQSGERACNSAYACRDGKMLVVEPNAWAGGKGSCAICVDLQAVGALEFFSELYI